MTIGRLSLTAAAALLALATPAAAQFDPVADFQEQTPSCDAHPSAAWIGRASGESDENANEQTEPVSFVGCFETKQACETWLERASGLIDQRIIQNSCEARSRE
jgi:hypothetical protein